VVRDPRTELSAAVAAAPLGDAGASLIVGHVPDSYVLDRRFRGEIAPENARTEVRLGTLEAWRYEGLVLRRDLVATAYLAPTTGGPLLILCNAPSQEARAYLPVCERMATTIVLRGERPLPLSGIDSRGAQVGFAMSRLRRDRRAARRRLARATRPAGQADVARDLQRAYERSARRVESILALDEPAYEDLVGVLDATADAYGRLAGAAANSDRSGYPRAVESVRRREQAVSRVTADLNAG
jgi:hypothetical protein